MTENLKADVRQKRQLLIVRCCPIIIAFHTSDDHLHSENTIMKKGQSDARYYNQFKIIYEEYKERNAVCKCEHGSFKVKEIVYFQKKFRHIVMHTQSKKYTLKMSLEDIDLTKFLKINDKCCINLLFVKERNLQNVILKNGIGNTAQRSCKRYAVKFFVRLHKNFAGILAYVKRFLCDMTENWQVDFVQSSKAVYVRDCLK